MGGKIKIFKKDFKFQEGQAALTAVLFFIFISLALIGGFAGMAGTELQNVKTFEKSKQSYIFAEGILQDALYRLISGKNMPASLTYQEGTLTATTTVSDAAGAKEIEISGLQTDALRKIKAVLTASSGLSFHYGAQVGAGGLKMEENSEIRGAGGIAGSVYSNGSVEGENGAKITGDLIVAENNSIDNIIVLGTARANSINDSKICGDAYYQTIDSGSFSFLNNPSGSTCPDPETPGAAFPGSPNPPAELMPISQSNINQWKADAVSRGEIIGNCGDNGVSGCNIANNGTLNLGPKKITGNLVLTKKQTLVVTGTLHFTGRLDMDSSSGATIKCDPSFGAKSCMVIFDGWMHIKNNSIFQGSGTAGSYILMLTALAGCNGGDQTSRCTHHNAGIDLHNNATGAIFYAGDSMANLHNGVNVTELTAYKLSLDNNAIVTYEQGLANAIFSSGPAGGWQIDSWQEVP